MTHTTTPGATTGTDADIDAFAAIRNRLELAYRLCCSTAPKQAVGELLDVALKMPEWETVKAALARRAAPATSGSTSGETLPCPFCGGACDPEGWLGTGIGGASVRGPECEQCGATTDTIEDWNRRATTTAANAVGAVDGLPPLPAFHNGLYAKWELETMLKDYARAALAQQAASQAPITPEDREAYRMGLEAGRALAREASQSDTTASASGWKFVPLIDTNAMMTAAYAACDAAGDRVSSAAISRIYQAAVAAAPTQPVQAGEAVDRPLDLFDEIECDLSYLFGRASNEGHAAGQELAQQVKAKMQRARASLAPVSAQPNPIEYDRIVKADEKAMRAADALDGMGFTYDAEIGWLAPVSTQQGAAELHHAVECDSALRAAPAGQHSANPIVMAELRRWAGDDPGYAAMLVRRAITEIEELETELATRCRAEGGVTNDNESSDLAAKAPAAQADPMGDRWHSLVCDGTCSPPCENAPAAASAAQAVDAAEALAAIARFAKADHPNSSATFKERKEAREQIDAIAARIGAIDGPAPAPEAMTSGTLQTQLVSALKRLEQANDELCKLRTSEQYLSMIDGGQQDALYELDNAREAARQAVAAAEAMTSDQQAAHPDDLAVDRFAAAMKSKLAQKRGEGRGGWETAECADEFLAELLMGHTKKGDPVDVANFAMMLHQRNLDDMDIAVLVLRSAALEFAKRTAPMFMREAAHAQQPAAQAVCAPRWLKDTCNQGYQVERCATCGTYKGNPCRLSTPPAAAPSVSATWQWVPKIPTQAMIDNIAAFVDGRENDAEVIYRAMIAAAPTAGAAATSDDAALLDFLDTNVHKFRMGWQVGAAPVGNLSVRAIIMGGQPIREAIRSAMSAHQEPRHE